MRLFLLSVLASLILGLGHLPTTAAAGLPVDAILISHAVVLNGLLGVDLGWLYTTKGLESAMLAHFSAEVIVHVIVPVLALVQNWPACGD